MDVWSHYLVEFHLSKFEKISVPGQYLEVSSQLFIWII
jgi:hypothetical protein